MPFSVFSLCIRNPWIPWILSSFVPTLDIAAGAFFPQKKAVPDFLDMSKLRNLCFYAFLRNQHVFMRVYFKEIPWNPWISMDSMESL